MIAGDEMKHKWHAGITLIEVMLVMVIASTLILMGIRMYTQYQRDAEIIEMKYNIDALFQAMSKYYYANCNTSQFLDTSNGSIAVTMDTLKDGGYLTADIRAVSELLNTNNAAPYMMQFNPSTQRYLYDGNNMGNVAVWSMQITVDTTRKGNWGTDSGRAALSSMMGADCMSGKMTLDGSGMQINYPCRAATIPSVPNPKPSWERMMSNVGVNALSTSYWMTMPTVRMFNYFVSSPAGGVYSCGG